MPVTSVPDGVMRLFKNLSNQVCMKVLGKISLPQCGPQCQFSLQSSSVPYPVNMDQTSEVLGFANASNSQDQVNSGMVDIHTDAGYQKILPLMNWKILTTNANLLGKGDVLENLLAWHVCCYCKKDFCSVCSTLHENLRRCSTCHLLQETAFQRPQLMKLKVKDLRQYLTLRNIPTDSCREKEDLVELVLCHHGSCPEEEMDVNMDSSARSQTSAFSFFSALSAPSSSLSSPQGELSDRSGSMGSASTSQVLGIATSWVNANDPPRKQARASLSDLSTLDEIEALTIRQLKEILARNFVNYSGCCEKWELVEKVNRLYRENEENRKSCT
ncbi:hypothetical protein AB205_0066530 [Aquarana catesbeiana]|uniref:SAP domain-containing protein n=1 Tax=Aquarana catesbeiana TaxID=8400 RepID=A0A2G9NAY1_AQUCT|nr:hypothetical protein AB205_0066530 [Aquarana catesbeiana]